MQYYSSFCATAPKFNNALSEQTRQLDGIADELEAELDNLRGPYSLPLTDRGRQIILILGAIDCIIRNEQAKNNSAWVEYFSREDPGFYDYWISSPSKKAMQALEDEQRKLNIV